MARTEKESLIQDAVGLIVLGQCGSTPEVENRLAHCDGFGMVDDKSHRTADEGQRIMQEQLRRKHIYVNHFRCIGCGSKLFCYHWPFARERTLESVDH